MNRNVNPPLSSLDSGKNPPSVVSLHLRPSLEAFDCLFRDRHKRSA